MSKGPWRDTGRPRGRPSAIDRVLYVDDKTGAQVTVGDHIIRAVRAGCYMEDAAASAGVEKSNAYRWQKEGARVNAKLIAGARRGEFTRTQLRYADFSTALIRADGEATVEDVGLSQQIARGGLLKVTETTKTTKDGNVETTRRTEQIPADGAMVRWRLAQRRKDTWGADRIEVTGPDGGPVELSIAEKRARVLDTLDVLAVRLAEPDPIAAVELEPADDRVLVPAPPEDQP